MKKKKYIAQNGEGDPTDPKAILADAIRRGIVMLPPNQEDGMGYDEGLNAIQNYTKKGWDYKVDDANHSINFTKPTGYRDFNTAFKWLNLGEGLVTGIANSITGAKNTRKENAQYVRAQQPTSYENFDEQGLNSAPVYTKYGGEILKMPYGGGPLTAEGAKEILRDGTIRGHKLTAKQKKYFGAIAGGAKPHKKADGGNAGKPIEAEEGEVYKTTDDQLNKIPEGSGTHEEGGTVVMDAKQVLEDTSDKRTDPISKMLKLSPAMTEQITGFKPNNPVSHSKALEKSVEFHDKKLKKFELNIKRNVDTLKDNLNDKYAKNSLNVNLMGMNTIPTAGELFDGLFQHQEAVKAQAGVANPTSKYAIGGPNPINPYLRTKTTAGRTTPTNKSNLYDRGADYLKQWEGLIPGISGWDNKKAQSAIYDYMLSSDEGKGALSEMWRTYGLTAKGLKDPALTSMTQGGKFDPSKELDPDQLAKLKSAYVDGLFGARQVDPLTQPVVSAPVLPQDNTPFDTTVPQARQTQVPPASPLNLRHQPPSEFNEPLRWFDVAGPLGGLLSSTDRIPARYDAPQFNQLRLRQQNPLPSLQNAQSDYNAALNLLPQDGTGYANVANVFGKKYSIDNQVLGQYENANTAIKNQEIGYNTQVRDRQSEADVQARGVFEQKYLGSKEAQRQQALTSLDELYTRIAENRKLNREGNLLMQLYPSFDQNAQYNGYQLPLRMPLTMPNNNRTP